MSNVTLLRSIVLFYIAYLLLNSPITLSSQLYQLTGQRVALTDSESSLSAVLLILLGITDAIPWLEGNRLYFRSTSKVRFLVFGALAVASYFQLFDALQGVMVWSYSLLEVAFNAAIAAGV